MGGPSAAHGAVPGGSPGEGETTMNDTRWIVSLAASIVLSVPLYAGGADCAASAAMAAAEKSEHAKSEHKCTASTQECLNYMVANFHNKGWVGIELNKDTETGTMTVTRIVPDSPAEEAGFQEGDVLVALNGVRLGGQDEQAVAEAHKKMQIGHRVTYTVDRAGVKKDLNVLLGKIPDSVLAQWIGAHMLEHADAEAAAALAQK
jgi:predicted metalloprotease with PDZ domain